MCIRDSSILADCPGAGKTLQAIVPACQWLPAIVVCPSSVKYQWAEEILRISRGARVHVQHGHTPAPPLVTDWTIVSPEGLVYHHRQLLKPVPGVLLVDESH